MKKMFKKSIAMLIAVLMVISAMPFTAITAFAADSAEKSYVKANIASFNGFTGTSNYTYNGTDLSAGYSDYYSNIVYDDGEFLDGDVTINNEVRVKAFINSNVVLMYDGKNDTILPVVGDALKTANNVGTGQKYFKQIRVRTDTTGNFWELKEDWKGNSGTWNAWPTSSDMTVSYNNANSEFYMNKYSEYLFRNKLYYKGSSNTSTYYDAFTPSSNKIEFTSVHAQWGIGEGNRDTNFGDSNSNVYVINYKPILDKIDLMKQVYNSIQSNGEDKYCTDYLENFYKAAYKVMTLNPNNYPYSSGVESAVQSAAGAIKDVVDNYLTTATTEPTKHNYGTPVSVDAKNHKYRCSVCGTEKLEAHNIVDGKCTKCDYVPLDLSTYNAAITEADGIIANSDGKYTADSVNAYKTAVDTAKAKTYSTQKEIDAIISEIQSAQTLLQKARVTITFVVEKEDGTYTTDTKNPDWGESVNLDTQSNYVSKWTITVNGVTSKIDSNATAIDHIATEDATITAYVTDEKPDTKYSKVTFLGKNSAVVGIKYVAADTTVDTNTLLTVPAIPFYDASGWDRDTIVADGSDFTVKATYTAKAVNENKCNVHFNGTDKQYAYDSYVYLFNADKSKKYAMYADAEGNELITYLGGVDFSVPRRDDIYIKEVNANEMKAAIGFSGSYQQGLKSSFNVKFWLPEDATLIETGVDLVAKFPDGTVKRAHDRATKFNARNEYTYTASFGDSKKTVEFKPYLTYKKDGVKTTVYGTSQTVEFN
ncbi:hypothetical protein [uncultured Eubacterium sp.]|uniref:hypothetical protein n=1 Tax=uncultured Eubacterium sp. TaxID=165185 RepID=UPI002600CDD1|nr:hypothetical protein [uncultured Eubacterium sp.]